MFFSEVEGHMQKLSSFGRGKKFGLKSHLCGPSTQPFNCDLIEFKGWLNVLKDDIKTISTESSSNKCKNKVTKELLITHFNQLSIL